MRPEPYHFLAEINKKTCKLDKAKTKSSEHGILSIYLMATIDRKQHLSNLFFTQNSFMSTLSILSASNYSYV